MKTHFNEEEPGLRLNGFCEIIATMSMNGHHFRCYPNHTQESILLRWVGCRRFIYNSKVKEDRYFRTFTRKTRRSEIQPIHRNRYSMVA